MKIYTVETVFDDGCDLSCDCVCSTVGISVALAYIRENPITQYFSYLVTVFDGFSGKPTHNATVNHIDASSVQTLDFKAIK